MADTMQAGQQIITVSHFSNHLSSIHLPKLPFTENSLDCPSVKSPPPLSNGRYFFV